ncbi:Lsr2 family DNA-binding protein [Streptomyces sp. 8N706]|uniref:Lsr2 family DNA-binding protein n=1 Tax=Streptomyces sp. 8N706 TaxID=3457416 RepID=UPI003FD54049
MFNDWQQALEAESLALNPSPEQELAAASRVTARNARDKEDLSELLGALGVPTDEGTVTALLPLLPAPDTATTGDTMPTEAPNAYTAVAASMLSNGAAPEHVRSTLGLSEDQLADALRHVGPPPAAAPAADAASAATDVSQAADHGPGSEADTGDADRPAADPGIEALLTWGEQHNTKGVQALAARARTALAELANRRESEHAVADAEARVGKLESELARARQALREAKSGKPAAPVPAAPAPAARRRTKEELAAIRTWARANGHQVADRGLPARAVLDAYAAAQRTTEMGEAS